MRKFFCKYAKIVCACILMLCSRQSFSYESEIEFDMSKTSILLNSRFNGYDLMIFGYHNRGSEIVVNVKGGSYSKISAVYSFRNKMMWFYLDLIKLGPVFFLDKSITTSLKDIDKWKNSITKNQYASWFDFEFHHKDILSKFIKNYFFEDVIFGNEIVSIIEKSKNEKKLWDFKVGDLKLNGKIFSGQIHLPSSSPPGVYVISAHLFDENGFIIESSFNTIFVKRSNIIAYIDYSCKNHKYYFTFLAFSCMSSVAINSSALFSIIGFFIKRAKLFVR